MVTMSDVAQLAGVSTATVSRVLNGAHLISPATAARVHEAMQDLHYRPNRIARSLRAVSTQTIGVIVSNVANPFFAELVRSIEDSASALGLSLFLGNASELVERQDAYLHALMEQQVDGLLVTPTGVGTGWVEEAARRGIPVVFIDRTLPGVEVPSVTTEHQGAINELVDHLVSLGHRTAALATGVPTNMPTRHRVEAFVAAAAERGLIVRPEDIVVGGITAETGAVAVRELLRRHVPDVLFTTNNIMALGALSVMREMGLRYPDDLAFVSYDDTPWFEVLSPPVTAVAQPVTALGAAAVELMAELIAGKEPRSITFPGRLIRRQSCGEGAPTITTGA